VGDPLVDHPAPTVTTTEPVPRYASIIDVHVIFRRGGRVLLLRRTGDTYASGQLCLPSGHVEEGESVLAAAVRETREEIGIDLDPTAPSRRTNGTVSRSMPSHTSTPNLSGPTPSACRPTPSATPPP
jgi:8-oxo-dGTP pyrophosphatase MutT (NUDIX family)